MLIAIPIKTEKENAAISPLFGHAKWFAFIKDDEMKIERNPYDGGSDVVKWLLEKGVDVVITQHIGLKPYVLLAKEDVKVYYPGEGRVEIKDALERLKKGYLEEITEENIEKFARHAHKH